MIMTSMTLDLPRRFPWPTLLSVCIHGAVVAGLLYTSVHQVFLYPPPPRPPLSPWVRLLVLDPPQPLSRPPRPGGGPQPKPKRTPPP
ncbi:TonB system transport protein TonB, partial [Escherichia coli]